MKKETKNAVEQQKSSNRVIGKPFVKGQSGNPLGKKKGTLDEVTKFKEAIALFEKEQNKSIYKFILEKSLRNPQVLVAIFKALIPQQTESSIKVESVVRPYKDLSDEELKIKAHEIFNRTTALRDRGATTRA